jgi:endoglucanase
MTQFTQRLLAAVVGLVPVVAWAQPKPGEMIFQSDFEQADALSAWGAAQKQFVRLVPGFQSAHALQIEAPAGVSSNQAVSLSLPAEKLRGARILCEGMVKADAVTAPPHPWNGVKLMLHLDGPGGKQWLQQNAVSGTFDWKRILFKTTVPKDITSASLILGLEAVNGRVSFDDVKVSVLRPPRPAVSSVAAGPVYKGHDLPRLRGAMISTFATTNDLLTLGKEWGANHVRWQITWGGFPRSPADDGNLVAYDAWLEKVLKHVDAMLPVCQQAGIKVLIDLHTPPGGRNQANECSLFHEKRFQTSFLDWWEKIARRYRASKVVWGYDLVNEPVEGTVAEGLLDWQHLATEAARRIRAIDPDHAIIVEPEPWGGPAALENLEPFPVSNVVYSVHMYEPLRFTHQGVFGQPTGVTYPGLVDGKPWNKQRLRQTLQPVVDFQKTYGVHVYVGEFSAIRWAPDDSARRYLEDLIDLFEENGWDWAYHAFREWNGWSVEHGSDPKDNARSTTPTSRQQLLQSWFKRNSH